MRRGEMNEGQSLYELQEGATPLEPMLMGMSE